MKKLYVLILPLLLLLLTACSGAPGEPALIPDASPGETVTADIPGTTAGGEAAAEEPVKEEPVKEEIPQKEKVVEDYREF